MSYISQKVTDDFKEAVKNLVTEDDEPVDNMFSAQQQRLLVQSLYSGWMPPPDEDAPDEARHFLADANVGVFSSPYSPPIVPDVFISLDAERPAGWEFEEFRAYYIWHFEKPPDVVVEIVSNRKGGEMESKRKRYARLGVTYYVVFDPFRVLKGDELYVYEPGFGNRYRRRDDARLPGVGLSLTMWKGVFEEAEATWLRWCDADGNLLPTAYEYAAQAEDRAAQAEDHAAQAEDHAAQAEDHAAQAEDRAAQAEGRAAQAEGRATQAENDNARLREELERLRTQLKQA